MTSSAMKKFLALYLVPAAVMAEWATTDAAIRAPAEEKMRADWGRWMGEHGKIITLTEAAGKTKAVSAKGITDIKNEIMLYRSSKRTVTRRPRRRSPTIRILRSRRHRSRSWKFDLCKTRTGSKRVGAVDVRLHPTVRGAKTAT